MDKIYEEHNLDKRKNISFIVAIDFEDLANKFSYINK
jgi:hypothetical protein